MELTDGIQRPQTERQQEFYRRYSRYHNFSTQIIMGNISNIVYIQCGFLGHNNNSSQFQMMPVIGKGQELHLPQGLYILVDKGYRSAFPPVTPWRNAAGNLTRRLLKREHASVMTRVEHWIRRLKEFSTVSHL